MKKLPLILFFLWLGSSGLGAQNKPHNIVFQLNSADTLVHKSLMKQLNNLQSLAPGSHLEVVCLGPGIEFLLKDKSSYAAAIQELAKKGVTFLACQFTLKEKKKWVDDLLPSVGSVPGGIVEIVTKQEEGWSYIKSGN